MAIGEIRDFLDAHTPRLRSLEDRTRGEASPGATREALTELSLALEELRVSEEELRVQSDILTDVQQALETERERYHGFFTHLPDPCLVTDTAGVVREANRAAAELLGAREDALPGKPLAVFVSEEDRRDFRGRMLEGIPAGETAEWTVRLHPRNAPPVRVQVRVRVVREAAARNGLVWLFRNVPDGSGELGVVRDEASLMEAMLDALAAPACALDLDGTLLRWNRAASDALGWGPEMAGGACPVRFPGEEGGGDALLRTRERMDGVPAEVMRAGQTVRLRACVAPLQSGGERLGTFITFSAETAEARPAERDDAEAILAQCRAALAGGGAQESVYERLRTWIASGLHLGHLRPGSRLPSIRQVADAAGAEHRAVAAAYRTLAAEGLVEVRNRQGAFVAGNWEPAPPALGETAEWLAGVLEGASGLRIRVPQLADVVARWTTSARIRCACIESVEDERAALVAEMAGQWGMDAFAVAPDRVRADGRGAPEALHGAELIVTTAFHATEAHAAGRSLGVPVLVLAAGAEMVQAAEEVLARGPLTAVVADPAYAARLRFLRGSERLRVLLAEDAAALSSLAPAECVLLTPAARQRLGTEAPRMLVPLPSFVSRTPARIIAAFLIQHNLAPARRRG
ncbi:MAG TPA: PAS domain-containing protein [Longimicrobium sp.]|jgi:PAS domain S-box-containing protein